MSVPNALGRISGLHQMLNELAHTVRNDVHWGLVMSNDLRWLTLREVLSGKDQLSYTGAHMHPIGEAGRGGGDPMGLTVAADGTVVVAVSGTDEVAFGKEDDFSLYRMQISSPMAAISVAAALYREPQMGISRGP